MKVNSQVIIGLVQRGYIEQVMETPFPLQVYRMDVKRRAGRGLQLTKLPADIVETQPHVLRDRRPAEMPESDNG